MIIHIVRDGDTIDSIAVEYGVTVDRILKDNGFTSTVALIPGQSIVISYPAQLHIVQEGDTLLQIANAYGVTMIQLFQYNPFLQEQAFLYPGESLVISYYTSKPLATHGFMYIHINRNTLAKTLPLLSYLSVFNYHVTADYEIITYGEDSDIVSMAIEYGTVPLLMISSISPEGLADVELVYEILLNKDLQEKLIEAAISIAKTKGYFGINILISGINTSNQQLYIEMLHNISPLIKKEGFYFFLTINLNVLDINHYMKRDKLDYSTLSKLVDNIVFLQYYWGTHPGAPKPVNNIIQMRNYIKYVESFMPPEKIVIGLTTVGYDWEIPYRPEESTVTSLTLERAILLAKDERAVIEFDENSLTPYFNYEIVLQEKTQQHIVWFIDARSMNYLLDTNYENDILGSGIWGIMSFNQQIWTMICSRFKIVKYLSDTLIKL